MGYKCSKDFLLREAWGLELGVAAFRGDGALVGHAGRQAGSQAGGYLNKS